MVMPVHDFSDYIYIEIILNIIMKFKWTQECSEKVKEYRTSDHSARKTLNVADFVSLLNGHV